MITISKQQNEPNGSDGANEPNGSDAISAEKNPNANLLRGFALAICAIAIVAIFAGAVWGKYAQDVSATTELKVTVGDYTINKTKMQAVMRNLSTKPTTLKFVTGTEVPAGLTNIATTSLNGASTAGIQENEGSKIGVYQSSDGSTLYIAPMKEDGTAVTDSSVMYAPTDCSNFLQGSEEYTNLGSNLTSIECSNLNTSRVTTMANMFSNCSALTSLDVSNFDVKKVTNMAYMFAVCSKLTTLDISNFKTTSALTSTATMFAACAELTTLTLPSDFNVSGVTDMSYMFSNCYVLPSIDVSMFSTSSATNMAGMFNGCYQLTSLDLSGFNTGNVTTMKDIFKNNHRLQSITLGASFDFVGSDGYLPTPNSTYITGADNTNWYDTTTGTGYTPANLATFHNTLNATRTYSVLPIYTISRSSLNSALSSLSSNSPTSLKFVKGSEVPSGLTKTASIQTTGSGEIGTYYDSSTSTIYVAPASSVNSTSVMYADTFYYFLADNKVGTYITTIDLSNVDTSKATSFHSMFYNFTKLTSIDVSSFDTSNVTVMQAMFNNCTALKEIKGLENFDTRNVTNMSGMFRRTAVTSLDLSSFDTSSVEDMSNMFLSCSSLSNLNVSRFNTSSVSNMSYMFSGCSALTSVDLSSFNTSSVSNMSYMFYSCSALTSVDLSRFNTSSVSNMKSMFNGCSALTSLNISSFDTSSVEDMSSMFCACSSLTSLDLSKFDTSNTALWKI